MYTVDLHLKKETVEDAKYNLLEAIKISRKTQEKVLCLIVGYGSTGGTHKIKSAILDRLSELKEKKQIKNYITGDHVDIFHAEYQNLKEKNLLPKEALQHPNAGQIFVFL